MGRKHQHHDRDVAEGDMSIACGVMVAGIDAVDGEPLSSTNSGVRPLKGQSDPLDSRCSFLLSEESLQEILAFLFEILRFGRALEKIVQRFLYFMFRLFLNLGRQGSRI